MGGQTTMDMFNALFDEPDDNVEEARANSIDTLHTQEPSPTYKPRNTAEEMDYSTMTKTQIRSRDLQENIDFFETPQENAQYRAQSWHESKGKYNAEESGYYKDAGRLKSLFSKSRFQGKDPATLTKNSEKLQNIIYGGEWGKKNLGNTEVGDGYKYRGRGPLQLTGRANYEKIGKILGIDLVNKPELATSKKYAVKIALAYWKKNVKPRIRDFSNTKRVTKVINGGNIGLAERTTLYDKYIKKYET